MVINKLGFVGNVFAELTSPSAFYPLRTLPFFKSE
jgi:hypothetical protein